MTATLSRMTLREACTLAVGILGDEATATDVHRFLAADGWLASRGSVNSTLHQLRGTTTEITVRGRPGNPIDPASHTRWRLTEAARAWVRGGEPCGT